MKTITLLFALAMLSSAQARIGETVAECVQRYGKPNAVDATGLTFTFEANGLHLYVTFAGGKCVAIEYVRWKPWMFGYNAAETLPEAEQNLLLEANGGGHKWVSTGLFESYDRKTADGALYSSSSGRFRIITKEAKEAAEKKAADDAAAAKLKAQAEQKMEAEKKLNGL